MAELRNSVFISYRREASWTLVEALYQKLTVAGVDAFYDIHDIRAGKFERIIFNEIRARPYFLLVLTPGTLEGLDEPGDWLRREIETAIDCDRMIIPVYTPTFDLSTLRDGLPDTLGDTIAGYQGQELPHKYFDYAVRELVDGFLVPIDLPVEAVHAEDQAEVNRMHRGAEAKQPVTKEQLTAQERYETGRKKSLAGDVDGALADYEEAIRLDPNNANAHNGRGFRRQALGNLDGALADYDEAIRLDPNLAKAYRNRGSVRRQQGDVDGALADYDKAILLNPDYDLAYRSRGNARYVQGFRDGALADYDVAIRLNPDFAEAYRNRGFVRRQQGDLDGALADYEEAIRLDLNPADPFHDSPL